MKHHRIPAMVTSTGTEGDPTSRPERGAARGSTRSRAESPGGDERLSLTGRRGQPRLGMVERSSRDSVDLLETLANPNEMTTALQGNRVAGGEKGNAE